MNNILRIIITAILVISGIAGCSSQHGGIPDDLQYASLPNTQKNPGAYTIQPGDQLDIKFFYNPELNENLPVRPDGKITLQLIGEVDAAGRTPTGLSADLENRYSGKLRYPTVNVAVRGFANQQVFIDGEVEHPGLVDLTSQLSAWQAIIKAGGFKETAARDSVIVIRRGEEKPIPYRLDFKSSSLDQPHVSFPLRPFDVVFVPKTWIAEENKFVNQYVEKLIMFKGWYLYLTPFQPIVR
ncbi:polysaccharide biosynthesis/export family protein [Methylomagnum sp.]